MDPSDKRVDETIDNAVRAIDTVPHHLMDLSGPRAALVMAHGVIRTLRSIVSHEAVRADSWMRYAENCCQDLADERVITMARDAGIRNRDDMICKRDAEISRLRNENEALRNEIANMGAAHVQQDNLRKITELTEENTNLRTRIEVLREQLRPLAHGFDGSDAELVKALRGRIDYLRGLIDYLRGLIGEHARTEGHAERRVADLATENKRLAQRADTVTSELRRHDALICELRAVFQISASKTHREAVDQIMAHTRGLSDDEIAAIRTVRDVLDSVLANADND